MTIKIKELTVKNFMSVGNATQAINFDRNDLTLVLGTNVDLGGDDNGARNGTGKTTIINALSYALYGHALTNIKKDNLINKTNGKNLVVTIDFEKDGVEYKIERGRKPSFIKFYVGGEEKSLGNTTNEDDAQGDSRETQSEIERLINLSHDMFKHLVALNTYTEPFLSLRANDQRTIIEQLLGITLLSEKAELLKANNKETKDQILSEEFRIKAVTDANKKIEEQIESLKNRQKLWKVKKAEEIKTLESSIRKLEKIDIESEVEKHKLLEKFRIQEKEITDIEALLKRVVNEINKDTKIKNNILNEIESLNDHKCHSCGQLLHDKQHTQLVAEKKKELKEYEAAIKKLNKEQKALQDKRDALGNLTEPPAVYYASMEEAINHKNTVSNLYTQLKAKNLDEDPYEDQIEEMTSKALEKIEYDQLNALVRLREHQEFLLKLLVSKDSFIRKKIIDQNLTYLNGRLSHYLDRLGLPHSVLFKNDLSVEITELGRDLDFDNLSRGERNRLILSLSWAFRDVWESLYQQINLVFLDEMLDSGLDSSGVENSMAVLKEMARRRNKSVWLVSHKDDLVSRVQSTLQVIKEGGFTSYSTAVEIT